MDKIYISLDLETTGFNPLEDKIIEVGIVKFQGNKILDTWQSLVNPGQKIKPAGNLGVITPWEPFTPVRCR